MKVNPADKPKVIALVSAIVLIGAYGVVSLIARKPAAPSITTPAPGADLPTAAMLAEGKYKAGPASAGNPDLISSFQESPDPLAASINPFRSPVPRPRKTNENQTHAPAAASPVRNDMPPSQIRGGGFAPVKPLDDKSGPTIESTTPILVKGIISPESDAASGQVFIQMNDSVKGYRVGDRLSPGIKVVAISSGSVTVKIGKREVKASVGKELKL